MNLALGTHKLNKVGLVNTSLMFYKLLAAIEIKPTYFNAGFIFGNYIYIGISQSK